MVPPGLVEVDLAQRLFARWRCN